MWGCGALLAFDAWRELFLVFPILGGPDGDVKKWICIILLMFSNLIGLALVVISIAKGGGTKYFLLGVCGGLVGIYMLMFLRFALEVVATVGGESGGRVLGESEVHKDPVVVFPRVVPEFLQFLSTSNRHGHGVLRMEGQKKKHH